jgi:NO-binding membrane sensor protein with MHYT domain
MFFYSCIKEQHDLRLVVLAACVCVFACFTAVNLLVPAREAAGKRCLALMSTAAGVFGASVWTTHFIAELAFKPGLPVAYDADLTALSLAIAIIVAWLGMVLALQYQRPILGGCAIGVAVGAMHYVGTAAMRVPAHITWNLTLCNNLLERWDCARRCGSMGCVAGARVATPAPCNGVVRDRDMCVAFHRNGGHRAYP